uniref:L1 transposable element RRM domain-containing protein n=1 Tax=Varanus komodoensis TaxID=61221 RepID=A0A8D2LJZ4_VARKO
MHRVPSKSFHNVIPHQQCLPSTPLHLLWPLKLLEEGKSQGVYAVGGIKKTLSFFQAHGEPLSPTTVEESVQELLEQMVSEHHTLGQAMSSVSSRLAKLEKRLEEMGHQVEALEAKVVSTQGCVVKHSALMRELAEGRLVAERRLEDLENKARARNLRVTGIPATVEDTNLIPFIENLVLATLDLNGKEVPICIESAYRLPASGAQEGSGNTVLIMLSDLRHRERILKASWASWTTKFNGHKISFFPDLSPVTYARRKHFMALRRQFLKEGAWAAILYPAKLKVVHQGRTYIFKDNKTAAQLLDRIQQGSAEKRVEIRICLET